MNRVLALSSSGSAARPASSSSASAERPGTSTTPSNQVSITTLRGVQLWLAQDHIATCTSAETQRIREAVAVLSRPKPRKEDLRPLQPKWQVSQKQSKKARTLAHIIQEFQVKIIKAAQELQQQLADASAGSSSPGSAARPAATAAPSRSAVLNGLVQVQLLQIR